MIKQVKNDKLGNINVWAPGDSFLEHSMFQLEINGEDSIPNYFYDIGARYFSINNCIDAETLNNYEFLRTTCARYLRRMLSKIAVVSVVLKSNQITPEMFSKAIENSLIQYSDFQIQSLSDLYISLQPCILCNNYSSNGDVLVCLKGLSRISKLDSKFNTCDGYEPTECSDDLREDWKESIDKFREFKKSFLTRKRPCSIVHIDDNGSPWFYLDVVDYLSKTNLSEFSFLGD